MAGTEGCAPLHAAALLNGSFRGAAYPTPFGIWAVKFHLDHPGPVGTANPAVYTTRTPAAFSVASATLGTIANSGLLTHATVPATELWKYFTMWPSLTVGAFFWSGSVNGGVGASVTAGTSPTTAVGELVCSLGVAS